MLGAAGVSPELALLARSPATPPMTLRYLALGDSYSIGEGVADEQRWPLQLARALRQRGITLDDPQLIARTGWSTDELDAGIDAAAPRPPFDLVSLLIGVNNQYRGRSLHEYRTQYRDLLVRAIDLAGGRPARLLALSIPDWGCTPFARAAGHDPAVIAAAIDAFNAAAAAICADYGVVFVDITAPGRASAAEPAMLAADGLHPSAALYADWSARALPWALAALDVAEAAPSAP